MAWVRGDEVKIIRQFEEQEEFSRPSSACSSEDMLTEDRRLE